LVPIGSVAFAYVGIRAWAMGVGLRENGLPWSARGIAALEASGRYLWMTLDGWQPGIHLGHLGDPSLRFVVLGAIAWLAAGTLGWRFWRRPTGQQLAALATLAVSLTLVLHVIPITINVAAADRFLYLPLAALALCLAPWIASLAPGRATLALALLALSYAPVTFARAQIWADEVAFWSKAFREQSHHNGMSRLELGNVDRIRLGLAFADQTQAELPELSIDFDPLCCCRLDLLVDNVSRSLFGLPRFRPYGHVAKMKRLLLPQIN
jgi:hypothetical protein